MWEIAVRMFSNMKKTYCNVVHSISALDLGQKYVLQVHLFLKIGLNQLCHFGLYVQVGHFGETHSIPLEPQTQYFILSYIHTRVNVCIYLVCI